MASSAPRGKAAPILVCILGPTTVGHDPGGRGPGRWPQGRTWAAVMARHSGSIIVGMLVSVKYSSLFHQRSNPVSTRLRRARSRVGSPWAAPGVDIRLFHVQARSNRISGRLHVCTCQAAGSIQRLSNRPAISRTSLVEAGPQSMTGFERSMPVPGSRQSKPSTPQAAEFGLTTDEAQEILHQLNNTFGRAGDQHPERPTSQKNRSRRWHYHAPAPEGVSQPQPEIDIPGITLAAGSAQIPLPRPPSGSGRRPKRSPRR
jgi:hypothetical protein